MLPHSDIEAIAVDAKLAINYIRAPVKPRAAAAAARTASQLWSSRARAPERSLPQLWNVTFEKHQRGAHRNCGTSAC